MDRNSGADLMAKILQDDDKFIVNRSNTTKTVESSKLMAEIQDTDWMVVNRGDQTYKISGEDVKDSLEPDVPEFVSKPTLLTPVNGASGLSRDGLTMTCTEFSGTGDRCSRQRRGKSRKTTLLLS